MFFVSNPPPRIEVPNVVADASPENVDHWPNGVSASMLSKTDLNLLIVTVLILVVVALVIILIALLFNRFRGRDEVPRCRTCGHDLRGGDQLPPACHECGRLIRGPGDVNELDARQIERRRSLGTATKFVLTLGLVILLPAIYLHPRRFANTPNAWLTTIDAWWTSALPIKEAMTFPSNPKISGFYYHEIWRRGIRGDISDDTLKNLAEKLISRNRGGSEPSTAETEIILATAFQSGLVTDDDVLNLPLLRPRVSEARNAHQLLAATTHGIRLQMGVVGMAPGIENVLRRRNFRDLRAEVVLTAATVDGRRLESDWVGRLRRWPISGTTMVDIEVVPPPDQPFSEHPGQIELELETRLIRRRPDREEELVHRERSVHRVALPAPLNSPPRFDRTEEFRAELNRDLAEHSVFEFSPDRAAGVLILRSSRFDALELGTPTLQITIPIAEVLEIEVEPDWVSVSSSRHKSSWQASRPPETGPPLLAVCKIPHRLGLDEGRIQAGDFVDVTLDATDFDPVAWWSLVEEQARFGDGEDRASIRNHIHRILRGSIRFSVPVRPGRFITTEIPELP